MALIEIRGLTKLYRMGDSVVHALDSVDLDIERGEFIAITGASGSGKSTIMHLLGCLDRPTAGSYSFNGRDVGYLSDRQLADIRNRQIGFVFQTFNLINRTSALENVAVPLFYARRAGTQAPARKALEMVGLTERATHRSNELSGGERQRVAIARAMVNDPLLLLADEPTGNLDSRTGQQIMGLFRALNEQGVTIVLVTHEYDVAIHTRRIVQMRDGKIVSDRLAEQIRQTGPGAGLQARSPEALAAAVPALGTSALAPGSLTAPAGAPAPAPIGPTGAPSEPAVPIGPAESPEQPVDYSRLGPSRMLPGATAALILGILTALLLAGAFGLSATARQPPPDFKPGDPIPAELWSSMIVGLISGLMMLAAFALGIITIVVGWRVRRRKRREPGNWTGGRRVLAALILGWVVVLGELALIAVGVARAVQQAQSM